jgi:hypothetical protein
MKKLITTFLILFTFSNYTVAGFFGDFFKDIFSKPGETPWSEKHLNTSEARCKVEYTQLDLATGLEKNVKHTTQYVFIDMPKEEDIMYLSAQDLTDKINTWLNENKNNVITNLTIINCKEKKLYINQTASWRSEMRWSEYKGCPDEYNIKLIDLLDRPKQWGYNVHKERLIKDYEDGCKNYNSNWK